MRAMPMLPQILLQTHTCLIHSMNIHFLLHTASIWWTSTNNGLLIARAASPPLLHLHHRHPHRLRDVLLPDHRFHKSRRRHHGCWCWWSRFKHSWSLFVFPYIRWRATRDNLSVPQGRIKLLNLCHLLGKSPPRRSLQGVAGLPPWVPCSMHRPLAVQEAHMSNL